MGTAFPNHWEGGFWYSFWVQELHGNYGHVPSNLGFVTCEWDPAVSSSKQINLEMETSDICPLQYWDLLLCWNGISWLFWISTWSKLITLRHPMASKEWFVNFPDNLAGSSSSHLVNLWNMKTTNIFSKITPLRLLLNHWSHMFIVLREMKQLKRCPE